MAYTTNEPSASTVAFRQPEAYAIEHSLLEMTSLKDLGRFLKERREGLSLSPKDIYQAIQLDDSSLSRMENGQRMPSQTVCEKIADYYNLPRYLFGYVVRTLIKNDPKGTSQPLTPLDHYLQLSSELMEDLTNGRISVQTADQIVTSWEGIVTAIKDLNRSKQEQVKKVPVMSS